MAFLDASILNDYQATEFAVNEKRESAYGMLDLAADSTQGVEYIAPSTIEMFKTISGQRGIDLPYMLDQEVKVSTTPGFDQIPLNLGESGTYNFVPVDIFSGFRFYPAAYENSTQDADWWKMQLVKNVDKKMAETADSIIQTYLEARKTQVLDYTDQISQGAGTYSFASSTLTIAKAAQQETMFYNLSQLMQANKLPGNYKTVLSPAGFVANDVAAQMYGAGNDKNIGWQQSYMPMSDRYISHQISTSANFNGYLVRNGGIGIYENFPFNFRNGIKVGSKEFSVSDVKLPYSRLRANVYVNKEVTEATSLVKPSGFSPDSNLIMTHFEEMALWLRFYVVYRVNSDLSTRANDIVKLVGATA